MIEVTTLWCPESGAKPGEDSSTHHLVPRSAGQGLQQHVCKYCGKTEKQLREGACPTCGQPDNSGDCNHVRLSAEDVARMEAEARPTDEPRGPRTVLFVDQSFLTPNGYVPGAVTEGVPGYGMMLGNGEFAQPWYWGHDLAKAQAIAEESNQRMGISPAEARRIIDDSIREQNIEEARQRSSQEKWERIKAGKD